MIWRRFIGVLDPEYYKISKDKNGKIHNNPLHLGEIQFGRVFVVGPGCTYRELDESKLYKDKKGHPVKPYNPDNLSYKDHFKGEEREYQVIDDSPIATITLDELEDIIKILKINKRPMIIDRENIEYSNENKGLASEIGLKIEDLIDIDELYSSGNNIYQGVHPVHGSESGMNFCVDLNNQIWCCFRHSDGEITSGGDAINLAAVVFGIIDCEQSVRGFWKSDEGKKKYVELMAILREKGYAIPEIKKYDLTEMGNANRFADKYKSDLKYCTTSKQWLFWDKKMWVICSHLEEERYAKTIPEDIRAEIESIDNEEIKKIHRSWYKQSASYMKLKNILHIARSDNRFAIDINDFLSDTKYFNMQNGVLNTETFEFQPHDRKMMLSKMSNVVYDPEAKCPRWLNMMEMIFADPETKEPDKELINYVQRVMGYVLTGKPINQVWFTFYGPKSKNGKSTFCNAISYVLGEYAKKVGSSLFSMGTGISIYHNPLSNKSLCQSPRKNSSG